MSNALLSKYKARPNQNSYLQISNYNRGFGLSVTKSPQNYTPQRPPSNGNTSLFKYSKNGPTRAEIAYQPTKPQYMQSQQKTSWTGFDRERQMRRQKQNGVMTGFGQYSNAKRQGLRGGFSGDNGRDGYPPKSPSSGFQKIDLLQIPREKQNNEKDTKMVNETRIPSANQISRLVNLVGLENIGNTCYMYLMQYKGILFCSACSIFQNRHSREMSVSSKVAQAYARVVQLVRGSNRRSQNPGQIKSAVGSRKPRFSGYSQQDAQQFLAALLQQLSLDLNRSKNPKYKELTADLTKQSLQQISDDWWNYNRERQNSVVCDYFTGQLLSRVVCGSCRNQSIAFDNTWDFALNFTSSDQGDLQRMLQNFLREETISSDYYCSKCKDFKECRRKLDFYRLPSILVLQLKRFSFGKYSKQKINTRVRIPMQLNLSKLVLNSSHCGTDNMFYSLVGVVHHSGDINFGHYTAQCRNVSNRKWYLYNDSSVSQINNTRDHIEGSTPYLLFFAKNN